MFYGILNTTTGTVHIETAENIEGSAANELLCGRPMKSHNWMRFASLPTRGFARGALLQAAKPCEKCARKVGLVTPVALNYSASMANNMPLDIEHGSQHF